MHADDVAHAMNEAAADETPQQWAIIWRRNDDGTYTAGDEVLADHRHDLGAWERMLPIGRTDWTGDDIHAEWAEMLRDEFGPWTDIKIATRRGSPLPSTKVDQLVTAAINAVRHRCHRNLSDRMVRVRLSSELNEWNMQSWRIEWDVTGGDTISASAPAEELRHHFRWHVEQMVDVREPLARP